MTTVTLPDDILQQIVRLGGSVSVYDQSGQYIGQIDLYGSDPGGDVAPPFIVDERRGPKARDQ